MIIIFKKNQAMKISNTFISNCLLIYRSSHRRCFVRKGALRNFANSQENTYGPVFEDLDNEPVNDRQLLQKARTAMGRMFKYQPIQLSNPIKSPGDCLCIYFLFLFISLILISIYLR